ncbi:hypothetical protein ACJVC5_18825 [Peredibacter sp. HCB2-198]|uniref:hypothetical protein n=1 Tax=Peredibacter sp. HCB2-198 TaxID=3383025 RepID=UPI0038B66806
MTFLPVFNYELPDKMTWKEKLEGIEKKFGIKVIPEVGEVFINDKKLEHLKDRIKEIVIIKDKLIILDKTKYRNVHAFSLSGEWLWDIEPCSTKHDNDPVYYSYVSALEQNASGKDLLILGNDPYYYETELETGKNTVLQLVRDNTNEK